MMMNLLGAEGDVTELDTLRQPASGTGRCDPDRILFGSLKIAASTTLCFCLSLAH